MKFKQEISSLVCTVLKLKKLVLYRTQSGSQIKIHIYKFPVHSKVNWFTSEIASVIRREFSQFLVHTTKQVETFGKPLEKSCRPFNLFSRFNINQIFYGSAYTELKVFLMRFRTQFARIRGDFQNIQFVRQKGRCMDLYNNKLIKQNPNYGKFEEFQIS